MMRHYNCNHQLKNSIAEIEGTGQLNEAELDFIRATVGESTLD